MTDKTLYQEFARLYSGIFSGQVNPRGGFIEPRCRLRFAVGAAYAASDYPCDVSVRLPEVLLHEGRGSVGDHQLESYSLWVRQLTSHTGSNPSGGGGRDQRSVYWTGDRIGAAARNGSEPLRGLKRVGLVMDPFLGLGSTAIACAALGLDFVGIELDRQYLQEAIARTKRALDRLF